MTTATSTKNAIPAALRGNWPMMSCCPDSTTRLYRKFRTYTPASARGIVQKKAAVGRRRPQSAEPVARQAQRTEPGSEDLPAVHEERAHRQAGRPNRRWRPGRCRRARPSLGRRPRAAPPARKPRPRRRGRRSSPSGVPGASGLGGVEARCPAEGGGRGERRGRRLHPRVCRAPPPGRRRRDRRASAGGARLSAACGRRASGGSPGRGTAGGGTGARSGAADPPVPAAPCPLSGRAAKSMARPLLVISRRGRYRHEPPGAPPVPYTRRREAGSHGISERLQAYTHTVPHRRAARRSRVRPGDGRDRPTLGLGRCLATSGDKRRPGRRGPAGPFCRSSSVCYTAAAVAGAV